MRVLPPEGPPQRVSSGPFPGAESHVFCKAKPVKLKKVVFSRFFDTLKGTVLAVPFISPYPCFFIVKLIRFFFWSTSSTHTVTMSPGLSTSLG